MKENVKVLINSKMKKHELLKYAYDNYPAGTVARFKCKNSANHTSCGSFVLTFDNDNGLCVCSEKDESNTFYTSIDSHTGNHIEEWAKVVAKPEEEKVFVMTSEDGVKLYYGDEYYGARFLGGLQKWKLADFNGEPFELNDLHLDDESYDFPYLTSPINNKAFSTKEAAEKWILEANRPKEIELFPNNTATVIIRKEGMSMLDKLGTFFSGDQLEEMYNTYKSLQ